MTSLKGIWKCWGVFLVMLAGCAQVRDYVGVKEGAFGLNLRSGFDQGADRKDYYLTEEGDCLVIGDTKDEITALVGAPDKIKTTLEGYEEWVYEDEKVKLFFGDERLKGFSRID